MVALSLRIITLYYKRKSDKMYEWKAIVDLLYLLSYERWISIKSSGDKMKINF